MSLVDLAAVPTARGVKHFHRYDRFCGYKFQSPKMLINAIDARPVGSTTADPRAVEKENHQLALVGAAVLKLVLSVDAFMMRQQNTAEPRKIRQVEELSNEFLTHVAVENAIHKDIIVGYPPG